MKFWVDYHASMIIEADSEEEAEATFDQCYHIGDETRYFACVDRVEKIEENE